MEAFPKLLFRQSGRWRKPIAGEDEDGTLCFPREEETNVLRHTVISSLLAALQWEENLAASFQIPPFRNPSYRLSLQIADIQRQGSAELITVIALSQSSWANWCRTLMSLPHRHGDIDFTSVNTQRCTSLLIEGEIFVLDQMGHHGSPANFNLLKLFC